MEPTKNISTENSNSPYINNLLKMKKEDMERFLFGNWKPENNEVEKINKNGIPNI